MIELPSSNCLGMAHTVREPIEGFAVFTNELPHLYECLSEGVDDVVVLLDQRKGLGRDGLALLPLLHLNLPELRQARPQLLRPAQARLLQAALHRLQPDREHRHHAPRHDQDGARGHLCSICRFLSSLSPCPSTILHLTPSPLTAASPNSGSRKVSSSCSRTLPSTLPDTKPFLPPTRHQTFPPSHPY